MKPMLLGVGILLAAGALWLGQGVWRAHQKLVTLDVRNLPLAEVLRKIEKQTRTQIRAEKNLDARITLHVVDKPLSNVLDRLAAQAGAHWSTLYAVYESKGALKALDLALRGDGRLEPAGWKRIAPDLTSPNQPGPEQAGPLPQPNPGLDLPAPMPGQMGMMLARRTKDGPMVFFMGPGGQTEIWSPEELVMESPLTARLGRGHNQAPTAAAAEETARTVHGHWTTYLAFRKSSMGIGWMPPGRPGPGDARRGSNDRFATLTPEQRVRRARARLSFDQKPAAQGADSLPSKFLP
jgi:hypothetical protein